MANLKDITGQRFGRLVVLNETGEVDKNRRRTWLCQCDCGGNKIVPTSSLTSGETRSCGCLHRESAKFNSKGSYEQNFAKGHEYISENDSKEQTRLSSISLEKPNINNKSGVRGVCWDKSKRMWKANLMFQGKTVFSKRFKNKQDAIDARKEAEEKYFKPILEKYRGSDG